MSDPVHLGTLAGALADVTQWLSRESIEGVVIGGVAASLLGRPRLTRDVDALVLGDAIGWERILESAGRYRIEPRIPDPLEFARRTRVLLLRHVPSSVDVDVSLAALPFEREVIDRSSVFDAGRLRLRLPSVEDLVIMKALARRARDWSDIEGLFDVNEEIDLDRVRTWLREFASVLDMPEIHEDFEQMLRRRRRG